MRMAAYHDQDRKEQYSNNEEESPDYTQVKQNCKQLTCSHKVTAT